MRRLRLRFLRRLSLRRYPAYRRENLLRYVYRNIALERCIFLQRHIFSRELLLLMVSILLYEKKERLSLAFNRANRSRHGTANLDSAVANEREREREKPGRI